MNAKSPETLNYEAWKLTGGETLVGNPYERLGQHMLYVGEIQRADGGLVCSLQSQDHCGLVSRGESEFYAHLILAAPAMLEALKKLIEYPNMGTAIHPGCLDWEDVRAILARLED